jgi:hypothetical protein
MILAAADDARAGARRRPELGSNYWQVLVPDTVLDGQVVVCMFWIDEEARTVRVRHHRHPVPAISSRSSKSTSCQNVLTQCVARRAGADEAARDRRACPVR